MSSTLQEVVIPAPEFRGAALELGKCRDLEVCLDGPAGTGKTYACLFKVHALLSKYPGAKALVARKTNVALAGSAMATFREMLDPRESVTYFGGNKIKPAAFQYRNGSLMIVSGLDKPEKIRSFEFDLAYLNESTEMTIDDVEFARSRLRHGKLPYHQLIMDCNPDAPTHWLNQRMNEGITRRLESRHEHNPRYFDLRTQDWTEEGREYIFGILGGLTGVRLARYRYGIWAAASGTVYEDSWDRARNVIDRFPIPKEWPRYMLVDFGYTNPFVCKWYAMDPDGRFICYREIYMTKRLVEDHCKTIATVSGWFHLLPRDHQKHADRPAEWADPLPREIICDHDAEDRATLERHLGLFTTPAVKNVSGGIQVTAARYRPAGDGIPRLRYFRDCLVERDRELAAKKKPTSSIEEPDGYVWKQGAGGVIVKEEPVKEDDHGMDCLIAGTMIATSQGVKPIEEMQVGDYVLTRNGYKPVRLVGLTIEQAKVYTVHFSNGATLTGTGNHPIYRSGQGYIPLRSLRYGDIIEDIKSYSEQYTERYPLLCQNVPQNAWKPLSTKALHSVAIQSRLIGQMPTTTDPTLFTSWRALRRCTLKSGKIPMDQYLKGATFITETPIRAITRWIIWNVSRLKNTLSSMLNICQKSDWNDRGQTWTDYVLLHLHGTNQRQVEPGIALLLAWHTTMQNTKRMLANIAGKSFNQGPLIPQSRAIVPTIASLRRDASQGLITPYQSVITAEKSLLSISTVRSVSARGNAQRKQDIQTLLRKQGLVQYAAEHSQRDGVATRNTAHEPAQAVAVCSISSNETLQPVYNLTVENAVGEGEYFANGILVHNCDRYLCARFDLQSSGVSYFKDIWNR